MNSEQLEELANGFATYLHSEATIQSLARRVLVAEKLVEVLGDVPLGDGIIGQLVTAYREASK